MCSQNESPPRLKSEYTKRVKREKKFLSLVTVIMTSITTASLDYLTAKAVEYKASIPIVTPIGVIQQEITLEQKQGGITGIHYGKTTQRSNDSSTKEKR